MVAFKKAVECIIGQDLAAEAVQGLALSLQRIDNIHCCYCLSLRMLSVCYCVADNTLKKVLKDTPSFLIDQAANSLDASSASKAADSRLSYALDVITEDLTMTLCASFSKAFTSFSSARHYFSNS